MSKLVLKQNNPKIRQQIEDAGIKVCICTTFEGAVWLDYYPPNQSVHGVGFISPEEFPGFTTEDFLKIFERENPDAIECKNVEQFIKAIHEMA